MSEELLIALGVQLLASFGTVVATKTTVGGLEKRMDKVESCIEEMPKNYVPRTEVERALGGIENVTKQTNAMVQALVYAGGDREVARKAIG